MAISGTSKSISTSRNTETFAKLALLAAILVAVSLTFVLGGYRLFQFTMVGVYALAILGLNLLTGYSGQISLGNGAFYALGAYATAILMSQFGVPFLVCIPIAALLCGVAGYMVGFPALRLHGLYLALTTFALAVAVPQLLKFKGFEPWTGGSQGLLITRPDVPFGMPITTDQYVYLLTLAVCLIAAFMAWNLVQGQFGRALRAVRDHPLAAEAMGVDLARTKTQAFAISAALTGVAGALSVLAVEFVAPDTFTAFLSIFLFVGMVVGGAASLVGAVVGAAFIVFVPNLAEHISKAAPGATYGVMLILFLYLMPGGLVGLTRQIVARLRKR